MATATHCLFCFETLAARLERRPALDLATVQSTYADFLAATKPNAEPQAAALPLPTETPLFVTWSTTENLSPGEEHELRGCIGTFSALPLAEGLSSYALTAALDDTRFRPVVVRELPFLEVGVTLLTDFEPAADAFDWELGKHGLRISFQDRGRRYSATYLPDVAPEQGWTKEETIKSLMRKAGWATRSGSWRDVELQVVRYQGKKHGQTYQEFRQWRDWVDAQKK